MRPADPLHPLSHLTALNGLNHLIALNHLNDLALRACRSRRTYLIHRKEHP